MLEITVGPKIPLRVLVLHLVSVHLPSSLPNKVQKVVEPVLDNHMHSRVIPVHPLHRRRVSSKRSISQSSSYSARYSSYSSSSGTALDSFGSFGLDPRFLLLPVPLNVFTAFPLLFLLVRDSLEFSPQVLNVLRRIILIGIRRCTRRCIEVVVQLILNSSSSVQSQNSSTNGERCAAWRFRTC